jgi:hypothetical protein
MQDRRQFLRSAGRLAVAAGCGGVLATLDACSTPARRAHPPSPVTPGPATLPSVTGPGPPRGAPIDWALLAGTLKGRLILPGDATYSSARQQFNPRFDGIAPAAVAYCQTRDDVARSLAFARAHGVVPVPRSGGHSFAGWSAGPGLVVDVSPLSNVSVDAPTKTVRVGAGTKLVDLYAALAGAGLALAGGSCPTVGIAGLTLGGGMGVLDRKYGLTCDALQSLDVVTADSQAFTSDPASHSDLWWASRGGGGGSMAVATSFTFAAHAAGPIVVFTLEWPWAAAADVLSGWQAWGLSAPMELWSNCQLLATSGGGLPRLRVSGVFLGSAAAGDWLGRLTKAVGAAPSYRFVGPEPFLHAMMIEAGCAADTVPQCHLAAPGTPGVLTRSPFAAKSDFLTAAWPGPAVASAVDAVRGRQEMAVPGGGAIVLDLTGGAINQVAPGDTAFVHRNTSFLAEYSANWDAGAPPAVVDANVAWLRQTWTALRPFASGQAYQNYPDPDLADWQQAYYGANLARLTAVKASYDPDDIFHYPQSIPLP